MNQSYSEKEWAHLERVKELPCSVCDQSGPSDAHHIKQNSPWTVVALCKDCHTGSNNGIHGRKVMWAVYRMDELDALSITLERILS